MGAAQCFSAQYCSAQYCSARSGVARKHGPADHRGGSRQALIPGVLLRKQALAPVLECIVVGMVVDRERRKAGVRSDAGAEMRTSDDCEESLPEKHRDGLM
jgi:hypothetical protein